MLPPLNLADAKKDFFLPRKANVRRSTVGAKTPFIPSSVSKSSVGAANPRGIEPPSGFALDEVTIPSSSESTLGPALVASLTLVPREFFVIERNAILPTRHYPQSDYESNFTEEGLWETIVFPAITPHTRQQVVHLRQTLEKLRAVLVKALSVENASDPSDLPPGNGFQRRHRQRALIEYSKQEARIYSICFHELSRQVKCICREQSELLHEVRERYDSIIDRLVDYIKLLDEEFLHRDEIISTLTAERDAFEKGKTALVRENFRLAQQIRELERHCLEVDMNVTNSASVDDDEEAEEEEWQRQRREIASTNSVTSTKKRRDSIAEENQAAARVQTAFHKYQMRKAQHSLALRVEKNVAALDIQRSFRGFRERQRALHQRAVIQTIMKRRKEIAAVQLLQENVRAYLVKRRRSIVARRPASVAFKSATAPPSTLELASDLMEEASSATLITSTTETSTQLTPFTEAMHEGSHQPIELPPSNNTYLELFQRIFSTSGELIAAVGQLRARVASSHVVETNQKDSAGIFLATSESNRFHPQLSSSSSPLSLASIEAISTSVEDKELLLQAVTQARKLMLSLGEVFAEGNDDDADCNSKRIDDEIPPEVSFESVSKCLEPVIGVSTSTTSLLQTDGLDTQNSIAEPTKENQSFSDQTELDTEETLSTNGDKCKSNRFDLDDSLWRSATYYASLPANWNDQLRQRQLLSLLSTRDNRKQLVQLKQFISDVYETVIGKMRELPAHQLPNVIKGRASLVLSCDEWERQYNLSARSAMDDPTVELGELSVIPYDIREICREHFRCQKGLSSLVEEAMRELHTSIELFAPLEPDVEIFRSFLMNERPYEEFAFRCILRYMCAQSGISTPGRRDSEGYSMVSASKQPILLPSTMREIIPVAHALQAARTLFRIDEQEALIKSDNQYIEDSNPVYQRYLPTSGLAQCEEIFTTYFSSADDLHSPGTSSPRNPVPEQITATHKDLTNLVRPTNRNQFHTKQYNTTASRSPLVRRRYHESHRQLPLESIPTSGSLDLPQKWIYFDEFAALLLKYRAEMLNFHHFIHWARGLFKLALDRSPSSGSQRINDSAFAATLAPLSVDLSDRDLRNLFTNSLRQRHLQLLMPERTFISVVLQLLDNRMISVSKYVPVDRQRQNAGDALRKLLVEYAPAQDSPQEAVLDEDYNRAWRGLAQRWRARDAEFEDILAAIHQSDGVVGYRRALRLMQLRNELYDLLMDRKSTTLLRAQEVFEELIDGMEMRESESDSMMAGGLAQPGASASAVAFEVPTHEHHEATDEGHEHSSGEIDHIDDGPWPTAEE